MINFECPECNVKQGIDFEDIDEIQTKHLHECSDCDAIYLVEISLHASFRIWDFGDEYELEEDGD